MVRFTAARMPRAWELAARMLAAGDLGGGGLAVQEVDAREHADRVLDTGDLTAGRLAARVAATGIVRVLVARQEPPSGPQAHDTGQLQARPLRETSDPLARRAHPP